MLTDAAIRKAKDPGKLADGGCTDALRLGAYPQMSLAEAAWREVWEMRPCLCGVA